MKLQRFERTEDGQSFPYLVWRLPGPRLTLSSASLGGGLGLRDWVLNATVHHNYSRDDPAVHLQSLATNASLAGSGVGLMTAVWVDSYTSAREDGVSAWVTTGVDHALWAAAPSPNWHQSPATPATNKVGTINIVVNVETTLDPGALVNLASTVTEAKVQALFEAGHEGTGTATDAFCIMCIARGVAPNEPSAPVLDNNQPAIAKSPGASPSTARTLGDAELYGGIRSVWGAKVARVVHAAVTEGLKGLA